MHVREEDTQRTSSISHHESKLALKAVTTNPPGAAVSHLPSVYMQSKNARKSIESDTVILPPRKLTQIVPPPVTENIEV